MDTAKPRPVEEIMLRTRQGRMALLHWPSQDEHAPKVLCLHGWLDNAVSFQPLAQHLPALDFYALDFPGHGHSDHRPDGARYMLTEYVFDIDAVLGHSMGGGVSCLYSAARPERVRRLVLADGLGPWNVDESKTTRQLRDSMDWVRRPRRPLRQFDSFDTAVKARASGFLDISLDAARMICERAVEEVHDADGRHYRWRTDPALKWDSPVMISEGQIMNCLENIQAPVLSFHAKPWRIEFVRERMAPRKATIRNGRFHDVEGNHHFHMDEAERIAPLIQDFILENDS